MNFTNLPDSLPPPCGGRLLTDTDIVDMLRRAGAPPHRPEPGTLFAISSLRALINALASLRPKSEAERHHRRQDSTVEETIFEGCTLALKGIAMVVGGIEDELEWLTHDLPDPNDPRSWVEQHGRLISNYERAMRRLTATQTVLDELAAQFVDPPTEFVPDVRRASPRHLGTMHSLYERITADSTLSKASSAVKFIALAMKEIGWEFPKNSGAIEQVLVRRRRQRRERSRPDATTCVK